MARIQMLWQQMTHSDELKMDLENDTAFHSEKKTM